MKVSLEQWIERANNKRKELGERITVLEAQAKTLIGKSLWDIEKRLAALENPPIPAVKGVTKRGVKKSVKK